METLYSGQLQKVTLVVWKIQFLIEAHHYMSKLCS
uniref:Uncharacterized protein n=1 Tax=Vitis vinifera TaxID=29760 RepID=F6H922_VITVI